MSPLFPLHKAAGILLACVCFFSCTDDPKPTAAKGKSAPDSTLPPDTLTAITPAAPIDTLTLVREYTFPICFDDEFLYNAGAVVMLRPQILHDVASFSTAGFKHWRKEYHYEGLLIYLGADSSGGLWTIEATEADASGYVFADLYCRENGRVVKRRRLLDSSTDCGEEASDASMAMPVKMRLAIYAPLFHLDQLVMDTAHVIVPRPATYATDISGSYYEDLKLTVKLPGGKPCYWFFGQGSSMCWFTYEWDVRMTTWKAASPARDE